jgi:hypothetical protein
MNPEGESLVTFFYGGSDQSLVLRRRATRGGPDDGLTDPKKR